MVQASPPQLNAAVFTGNMTALRQIDPRLSDCVAKLAASSQATLAVTRDGQISFCLAYPAAMTAPGGGSRWLGRTSIPAVRADALLDRFDAGLGNVLLPGIGQGFEVTLLLQRLARCRAVFVWEPDDEAVALCLQLHDWSAAFSEGRLVLLGGPLTALTATLTAWLEAHPGYLCPTRIMMWPWATPPELAEIRAVVQAAYESVEASRARELARLRQQLAETRPREILHRSDGSGVGQSGEGRSVLILSLQPREEVLALGDAIATAMSAAGEQTQYVAVRSAGDVHPLARIRQVTGTDGGLPDRAILLNATRQDVRDVLPDRVSAICWLETHAIPSSGLAGHIDDRDIIAVTHSRGHSRVLQAGIEPARVIVCPWPCLSSSRDPADLAAANRAIDVAIMADLPLASAERFGYDLPTHLQLWSTAVELLESRIDSFTDDQGELILTVAENRLRLKIDDPEVRRPMVETLSTTVANALLWRRLLHVLMQAGVHLAVYGHGWGEVAGGCWRGAMMSMQDRVSVAEQAKLLIHADVTGEVSSAALLAAGSGAVLLARAHPSDRRPGGLHTLFEHHRGMLTFRTAQDLARLTRQLVGDSAYRQRLARQAAETVVSKHTPRARLEVLKSCATSCSATS